MNSLELLSVIVICKAAKIISHALAIPVADVVRETIR